MIKHFCDKCGRELAPATLWDITIESRNTDTRYRYEMCSTCTLKLKDQLTDNTEDEK